MTSPELHFRQMDVDDIDTVMLVENKVYEFPWTEAIFKDCIRVGYECWLAELSGKIIGHAILSVAAGESHILNISVAPSCQGQGIGTQLIECLVSIAKGKQAHTIMLEVRATNLAAINCYDAAGFNEIGRRKDYYPTPNGREDALLYARHIG